MLADMRCVCVVRVQASLVCRFPLRVLNRPVEWSGELWGCFSCELVVCVVIGFIDGMILLRGRLLLVVLPRVSLLLLVPPRVSLLRSVFPRVPLL